MKANRYIIILVGLALLLIMSSCGETSEQRRGRVQAEREAIAESAYNDGYTDGYGDGMFVAGRYVGEATAPLYEILKEIEKPDPDYDAIADCVHGALSYLEKIR